MLRLIATLFIVNFLLVTTSSAKETKTKTSHLLWEVEGTDAKIYLFGTIHVGEQSMYPFPKRISQAIKDSEHLVFEVNLTPQSEMKLAMSMQKDMMYLDGTSLKDHIPSELYQKTISYLKQNQPMLAAAAPKMKPWALAITATMLEMQKAGFDAQLGIEKRLQHTAKVQKKKILELESIEFQAKLLANLPSQEKFLEKTMDDLPKTKELMTKVIGMWKSGDIAGLHKELVAPMKKEMPKVYKVMMTDRNINMAKGIEKLAKTKSSYFIALGSAHFIGEDSIIAMLRRKGYKINRK